jgi:hypothetical protein
MSSSEALVALKVGFLIALYAFVWFVVRGAARGVQAAPQESLILQGAEAAAFRESIPPRAGRLVVLSGPTLHAGTAFDVSQAVRIGRDPGNAVQVTDDYASGFHATVEPRSDGLWIQDEGSTNGTFVNGVRITRSRLTAGDVVRVGETDFQVQT